jgi:hypothetical protein
MPCCPISEQLSAADAGSVRLLAGGGRSVLMTCGPRGVRVHCRPTLCGEPMGRVDYLVSYAVSLGEKTRAPAERWRRTPTQSRAAGASSEKQRACRWKNVAVLAFLESSEHVLSLLLHTKAKATLQQAKQSLVRLVTRFARKKIDELIFHDILFFFLFQEGPA